MRLSVKARIALVVTAVVVVNVAAGAISWALYAHAARLGAQARVATERAKLAVMASQSTAEFLGGSTDLALSVSRANASEERSRLYGGLIGLDQTTNQAMARLSATSTGAEKISIVNDWNGLRDSVYSWINLEAQGSGADFRITRAASGRYRSSTMTNIELPSGFAGLDAAQVRQKVRDAAERFRFATLGRITRDSETQASSAVKAEADARQAAQWGSVALMSLSALIALLLGVGLYRSIARPLSAAKRYADSVAGGDYGAAITHSADEIGVLTHAVENMKEALVHEMGVMREMAGVVLYTTEGVHEAVSRTKCVLETPDHDSDEISSGLADVQARVVVLAELSQQMLGSS